MKQSSQILGTIAALALVPASIALWTSSHEARDPIREMPSIDKQSAATRDARVSPTPGPAHRPIKAPNSAQVEIARADMAPEVDEESILEQLRLLEFTNPLLSLELARTGDEHFPEGPTAAERSWFEARALVELGRFEEARDLAQRMVERYPETHFAQDVRRHLLSHPMGQNARR